MSSSITTTDLILSLTTILSGNCAKSESITSALQLICEATAFSCGAIYEKNSFLQFKRLEYNCSTPNDFPESVGVEMLFEHDCSDLLQGNTLNIWKSHSNSPLEEWLLTLYSAESLVLVPILDEASALYGLIALLEPTSSKKQASLYDDDMLRAALAVLVRYIELRMYQGKLKQSQSAMESIFDNAGIDIYVNDFITHDILYVNKSMAAPYGGQEKFWGQKCWQVLFPDQGGPCEFCPQHKIIDEEGKPTKVYTWDYQRAFDGSWFRVFSAAFRWADGRMAHVVSSADITDNKRNEALVENMAHYDQLTKLPNRRMLLKDCSMRINKATATEQGYVLFFDIDGFKAINDNYGHDSGDEFLIQLGEFFSSIPLLTGFIYRNGGDEFVAIIGGESVTPTHINNLASFIHDRFNKPWKLKNGDVFCNTSIGVARYPQDGSTPDVLLQKADKAMYEVKKSGGGSIKFFAE